MKNLFRIFFIIACFIFSSSANGMAIEGQEKLDAILKESLNAYNGVQDYQGVFYKQEESGGKLGEKEKIFLKFEKPFKIYMHWLDSSKKGLQVLYERGRHDGKLAIHKPGLLLGLAPVIFLDQSSPWVREGSKAYDIEDAGIGTFLNDFAAMVEKGKKDGKISSKISQDDSGQIVEASFPGSAADETGYFAYRVIAVFDAVNHLPVKMSLYDWNEKPTGIYEYKNLILNAGRENPEFKKLAQKQLYKLYLPQTEKPIKKLNFASSRA